MKRIFYFFGITLIILMTLGVIMSRTVNLSTGAEGVLMLIEKEQFQQAYTFFTKDFQSRYPYAEFQKNVKESRLLDYRTVKWVKEEMSPERNRVFLAGIITTKQNTQILIEMNFIKQSFLSMWLINDLRIKQGTNE